MKKRHMMSLALALVMIVGFDMYQNHKYVESLKSGEKELVCQMEDGLKTIDPNKIVDVDFETNTFIFTNGSATSCEVMK